MVEGLIEFVVTMFDGRLHYTIERGPRQPVAAGVQQSRFPIDEHTVQTYSMGELVGHYSVNQSLTNPFANLPRRAPKAAAAPGG
jgi:hypothetical protein